MQDHNIELNTQVLYQLQNRHMNHQEKRSQLKTTKPDFTPGITGTKRIFLWMMTVIPETLMNGYNQYLEQYSEDKSLDWIGVDWIGLDWIGLDWIGLDRMGFDWIGLDLIGLDRIGLD